MNRLLLHTCFFLTSFTTCFSQVTPGVKLISSIRNDGDYFGAGVAIDGQFAVVGASKYGPDLSYATIFERDGAGNWNEIQILAPSDLQPGDHFGENIALSGNYLAISAPLADSVGSNSTITDAGTVYIFERSPGGVWQQVLKVWAEDAATNDLFGRVALSGKYLVIGSLNDLDANGSDSKNGAGAAYVFERTDGGEWLPVQKLVALDRTEGSGFSRVAVDGYTKTIVVGAPYNSNGATGGSVVQHAGAIYVFKCDAGGNWNQTQKITASLRKQGAAFGCSVGVSGEHILTGALHEDKNENDANNSSINGAGAAYLFKNNGSGMYSQVRKLVAQDRNQNENFGNAVSLSGNYALVGAYEGRTDENGGNFMVSSGAAYLYEKSGNNWSLKKKLTAPDRNSNDEFATSVCISGAQMIVGAPREDDDASDPNILAKGAAYVFTILNPLGVSQNELSDISIYPNPTDGEVILTNNPAMGDLNLILRDVSGKLLDQRMVAGSGMICYAIDQPAGIYFLEVSTGTESVVKRVVVK